MTTNTDSQQSQHVVVTDIRMPFWSMVFFMVKWALAAIPALLLLAAISATLWFAVLELVGLGTQKKSIPYSNSFPSETPNDTKPSRVPYGSDVPERCKGSTAIDACIAEAKKLSSESPAVREQRIRQLEAEREANMKLVR